MFVCVSERERERIFTFMNVTTVKKLKGLWIEAHMQKLYPRKKIMTNKNSE